MLLGIKSGACGSVYGAGRSNLSAMDCDGGSGIAIDCWARNVGGADPKGCGQPTGQRLLLRSSSDPTDAGRTAGEKRGRRGQILDEKKERQAAKNRETARAFRNKMDGLKAYTEERVSALENWVHALAYIVITEGEAPSPRFPDGVRRCRTSHL